MKLSRFSVAVAAISAFIAADGFAQVGSVFGNLVDDKGNPIAGAECAIEKTGGGRAVTATSKEDGSFVRAGLRVGSYVIRCEKEGFRPLPLQVRVAGSGQGDLGQQVMFPLAPGELSEADHARATALLGEFEEASESGDNAETLAKLLELYEMMPTSTEILFNIASTYEKMGEMDNAVDYYTQAAEKNPDLAYDSWLAVGEIKGNARQWADAAAAMEKAVDIKQVDAIAMFNYAVYAQNAGDAAAATTAYEKTVEIDPSQAVAYYQLGLIAVSQEENDLALTYFAKFLELAPDHPNAAQAQGVIDALNAAKEREP